MEAGEDKDDGSIGNVDNGSNGDIFVSLIEKNISYCYSSFFFVSMRSVQLL
jgi:hypothetical protein